jgi:hypothetical protein
VDACPEGYPRLAAFLGSAENAMLYRRFGFLQARVLLNKQDEIRELEADLDHMDSVDAVDSPNMLRSRENDDAANGERRIILRKIELKFKEYGAASPSLPD